MISLRGRHECSQYCATDVSLHMHIAAVCKAQQQGHITLNDSTALSGLAIMHCRYVPSDVTEEDLAQAEAWQCDSRSAASACLLLLCAARESLKHRRESLHLVRALKDVCAALGRCTGHDSMVWGCDLDPGSWTAAQKPWPAGRVAPWYLLPCFCVHRRTISRKEAELADMRSRMCFQVQRIQQQTAHRLFRSQQAL